MPKTSTQKLSQSAEGHDQGMSRNVSPSKSSVEFIRQFARSCRSMHTSNRTLAIVNLN